MAGEIQQQSRQMAVLTGATAEAVAEIEKVLGDADLDKLAGMTGRVEKAFKLAGGIKALRKLITNQMIEEHIMPLMNTRLGFATDRDPNRPVWNSKTNRMESRDPYPVEVVKECIIEAMLQGAYPIGNEFNIISSGPYYTRAYFVRRVGEYPGVTDVVPSPGVPQIQMNPAGKPVKALIRYGLSWKKDGKPDCLRDAKGEPGRVFEIRCDAYTSTDAIIGKATRKAYAAALQQISGSRITAVDGEADDLDPHVAPLPLPGAAAPKDDRVRPPEESDGLADGMAEGTANEAQASQDEGQPTTQPQDESHASEAPSGHIPPSVVEQPITPPAAPQPPQQRPAAKPVESAVVETPKLTWDSFHARAKALAASQQVTRSKFERAIALIQLANGWKGRTDKATPEQLANLLLAIESGLFNWDTGTIKPAAA